MQPVRDIDPVVYTAVNLFEQPVQSDEVTLGDLGRIIGERGKPSDGGFHPLPEIQLRGIICPPKRYTRRFGSLESTARRSILNSPFCIKLPAISKAPYAPKKI